MSRGRLRIYLGAAPGVGKTYAMLNEGARRSERGTDVVVAVVETHGRPQTIGQLEGLEVVPRREVAYRGTTLLEMDLDGVIARAPKVALVDELAHTNAPGSRHDKRWQDVVELLDHGIDVISTVNVQHLESLNDVVEQITGTRQRETVPDSVVRAADQVEIIDMTPEAIRRRMAHGNIYPAERVNAALANYFRPGNLAALRELALLWLADKVEDGLQKYMADHGIVSSWETRERVIVALTGAPSGEHLIRRAARMARRAQGDLIGVHINTGDGLAVGTTAVTERLDQNRALLADLGGEYHEVVGNDVAEALLQFAGTERATQLVIGASRRSRRAELLQGSVLQRVIRSAGAIDVHVISEVAAAVDPAETPAGLARYANGSFRSRLSHRRVLTGWLLLGAGIPLLTIALIPLGETLGVTSDLLLFLLLVIVAAAVGGRVPGIVGAVVSSLVVNWFFTPPVHTFTINELENALALVIFVLVAGVVSQLVSQLTARELDATRASAEAEALARVAGGMAGAEPLATIAAHLKSTFGMSSVRLRTRARDGVWVDAIDLADSGTELVSGSIDAGSSGGSSEVRLPLGEDAELVLMGPALTTDDQRVLRAFTAQLASALENEGLRQGAAAAATRSEGDALRTAILRAVSHDLRTPLASIKASVTSLQQHDVAWSEDARTDFLDTIEEETDRLNRLVGNLLDMSRIEAGAVPVRLGTTDVTDILAAALANTAGSAARVRVEIPDLLPPVHTDAALVERALANLIGNALRYAPDNSSIRVTADLVGEVIGGPLGDEIHVRVIDQGPGVPVDERSKLFAPFRRLGDGGNDSGVGLGLAVANGFVAAVGGLLELDDTPGGGLTAVIRLPADVDAGLSAPPPESALIT